MRRREQSRQRNSSNEGKEAGTMAWKQSVNEISGRPHETWRVSAAWWRCSRSMQWEAGGTCSGEPLSMRQTQRESACGAGNSSDREGFSGHLLGYGLDPVVNAQGEWMQSKRLSYHRPATATLGNRLSEREVAQRVLRKVFPDPQIHRCSFQRQSVCVGAPVHSPPAVPILPLCRETSLSSPTRTEPFLGCQGLLGVSASPQTQEGLCSFSWVADFPVRGLRWSALLKVVYVRVCWAFRTHLYLGMGWPTWANELSSSIPNYGKGMQQCTHSGTWGKHGRQEGVNEEYHWGALCHSGDKLQHDTVPYCLSIIYLSVYHLPTYLPIMLLCYWLSCDQPIFLYLFSISHLSIDYIYLSLYLSFTEYLLTINYLSIGYLSSIPLSIFIYLSI